MTQVLLTDIANGVATLTLNRPASRNALNAELRSAVVQSLAALDGDESVLAIVLTGADPVFCAGLDLKEISAGAGGGIGAAAPLPGQLGPFPRLTKPLVGAINGAAVTGGLEYALGCDFLIASERAAFADTHQRVGIQPGWGLSVLLPEAVGLRRARQMSFTGNYIDAQTALAWGLVNEVVPHDSLMDRAGELAGDIASIIPEAGQTMLATYRDAFEAATSPAWELEAAVSQQWLQGFDAADLEARREQVTQRGRSQS
jgi:enoyl-CoA hydratase